MPKEIVLLTGEVEGPHLAAALRGYNPALSVAHVEDRHQLTDACSKPSTGYRRLIAFCTSVIVPAEVLEAVDGPAYNFHPGPPTYPGAHAASFAIYDDAKRFGVTAHEMEAKVDSGRIVAVKWFDIVEDLRFPELEIKAYRALVELFRELAPQLAGASTPLPRADETCSGHQTTSAEFDQMREIDETMSEAEIKRRFRAFV